MMMVVFCGDGDDDNFVLVRTKMLLSQAMMPVYANTTRFTTITTTYTTINTSTH